MNEKIGRSTPRAKSGLQSSETRFRALAESASDAIATIDTNSTILFVNRAAEKIFGYSIEEMVGQEITILMPDYLRHVHKAAIGRYTESGRKHLDWTRTQLPGLHKDGREIPIELSIAEHSESGEKRFTGILRDISERVAAEETLKRQTAVIQLLQHVAIAANQADTVGEAITTTLRKVCEHSGAALGHAYFVQDGSPATLVPSSLWYPNNAENFLAFRALTEATIFQMGEGLPGRVAQSNTPIWIPDIAQDTNFPRNRSPVELSTKTAFAFPVLVKGEVTAVLESFSEEEREPDDNLLEALKSVGAQLGRVIERKRSEESLRHLSARLLRSQDEERRHIGRELHDSIGQYLTALQMNLDALSEMIPGTNSDVRLKVSESLDLVRQSLAETRTLSYLLHPPLLEDTGLIPTVRWFVEGFAKRSGIDVTMEIASDIGRLKPDTELMLFRVIQECLTNIHRHSGSKTASIRIEASGSNLTLEIKDRGKGMSPDKLSGGQGSGVGIAGMSERLGDLGGKLAISSESSGTIVRASVPLILRPGTRGESLS
jgi:PAS domain S-box-containing protein